VTILPNPGLDPRRIEHFVHSKPGPLALDTLDADMERLYGTGLFENVQFDLQGTGPERELRIEPTAKSWGPTYVRAGLNFSSDLQGSSAFGILALIDATEMNRFGAQWKTRVELGTNLTLDSRFYQPLGYTSDAFVSPRLLVSQTPTDIFESTNTQRIAEYRVRRTGVGLDVGYDFGTIAEVRGGAQWGTLKSVLRTGLPQFPEVDANSGAFVAQVLVDQLDNAALPKDGYSATVDWRGERESLGSEASYDRLEASALGSVTFGRLTTVGRVKWGDPLGTTIPFYDQFQTGGLFNLSGYSHNQLFGSSYGLVEGIFFYKISKSGGAIVQNTYVGGSIEAGNVWTGTARTFDSLKTAGSVFISAETILGPFYFAYGYAGSKHSSFYVLLSRNF
jgi:NTE family protein